MKKDPHETINALVDAHKSLQAEYVALGQTIRDLAPESERDALDQRVAETSAAAEAAVTEIISNLVTGETEWLGFVIRSASFLEHQLRTTVAALLGSKYAAVAVAGQNTSTLVQQASALVVVRDDVTQDQANALKDMLKRSEKALDKRNRFAHSMWGNAADGSSVTMMSKYRKWDLQIETVTTDDLAELHRELTLLGSELMGWTMATIPDDASNEIQLRWEDYVNKLSAEERALLIAGRAQQLIVQGSVAQPTDGPQN